MNKIKAAGLEKITFAWAGSSEPRQPYFYQVQGPTFVLEHNNTQNNANHIHSVWRDYNGDFGRDMLGEHLAAMPHKAGRTGFPSLVRRKPGFFVPARCRAHVRYGLVSSGRDGTRTLFATSNPDFVAASRHQSAP